MKKGIIISLLVLVAFGFMAQRHFSDRGRLTTDPVFTGLARSVTGNDLVSRHDPALTLRFHPSFRHIGGQKFVLYGVADTEQHFFVTTNEQDQLQSLYWVQYEAYLPGKPFKYDYEDSPLRVHIDDLVFFADTEVVDFDPDKKRKAGTDGAMMRQFLASKGFTLPSDFAYARLVYLTDETSKKELMIIFIDDLAPQGLKAADISAADIEKSHIAKIIETLSVVSD